MDKGSGSGIFPDPDPDPGDPKRPDPTGSGSGSATLLPTVYLKSMQVLESEQHHVKNLFYHSLIQ